ncbi:MAG: TrkA family potassium uptake protein [Oscillospiraceae bacterium]|jgi:trk system potassium uptake protein TrkA|nr:TrkA family potassium uptake protein [Oscillospiraceae bacterium]
MPVRKLPGVRRPSKSDAALTVVVGCGRLGAHIASTLSEEGGSVVIIDLTRDAFLKLAPSFDGVTLTGDATELPILEEAGLRDASALIAVTERDNTNIMVAQMARALYGVPRVIARLYDPDKECVYKDLGIGTISPVLLSTKEIEHILRPPGTDAEDAESGAGA